MNNFKRLVEKLNADDTESFDIGKGLSPKEAKEKYSKFKLKKDHRGVHYNPKTGIVKFI